MGISSRRSLSDGGNSNYNNSDQISRSDRGKAYLEHKRRSLTHLSARYAWAEFVRVGSKERLGKSILDTKNHVFRKNIPSSVPGSGRSTGKGISYPLQYSWASLVAQLVKNLPAMWETWVWSLGWEDPLEKGKATQYSGLENSVDYTVCGVTKGRMRLSLSQKE